MYGWVDLQLDAVKRPLAPVVEAEYRNTLDGLTQSMRHAMRCQGSGLAESIWKALVALMRCTL